MNDFLAYSVLFCAFIFILCPALAYDEDDECSYRERIGYGFMIILAACFSTLIVSVIFLAFMYVVKG